MLNMAGNKVRVFLTSLGIIVGAFTIILVIGIGQGSQAEVSAQFGSLSAETIMVMPGMGGGPGERNAAIETLDMDDLEAIRECPSVAGATIVINTMAEVSYYNTYYSCAAVGAREDYPEINRLNVEYGEFFSDDDGKLRNRVAVIGSELVDIFFDGDAASALGESITLNSKKYKVIGVLQYLGEARGMFSADESVLMPYEVAEKYAVGQRTRPAITAQAVDINSVAQAMEEIATVLDENHRNGSEAFSIRDAGSTLVAAQESAATMSNLLISVAAVVLVVAGIGIMNVLLVSVKERTREIGILKAIGARRRDILLQFLLEAVMISITGGCVAVILSIILIPFISLSDITILPSLQGYVIALAFCMITGTFFGYYPAAKAAALKPIEALRHNT